MKKILRKIHRWLGLLMALQLIAWMGSGLYFAWFPIETIRGEHLVSQDDVLPPGSLTDLQAPAFAAAQLTEHFGTSPRIERATLTRRSGRVWYRLEGTQDQGAFARLVDAETGQVAGRLDRDGAIAIAMESLQVEGVVEEARLVTEAEPGAEYRGRRLPLWRVAFDKPELLHVYIDPWTRDIVAQRTFRWRVFDFLWMLHIMDYGERDDFNTPLLQGAAVLGLLVALSGVIYWAQTTRLFRRRRRPIE
ncbi:MAG: PepSY domain-containing protein [Planctomycetota bacterium]